MDRIVLAAAMSRFSTASAQYLAYGSGSSAMAPSMLSAALEDRGGPRAWIGQLMPVNTSIAEN